MLYTTMKMRQAQMSAMRSTIKRLILVVSAYIPRPEPDDHAAVARAQAAALESVGNCVAKADNERHECSVMPRTHLSPRKGAKDKTLHVFGRVSWIEIPNFGAGKR